MQFKHSPDETWYVVKAVNYQARNHSIDHWKESDGEFKPYTVDDAVELIVEME